MAASIASPTMAEAGPRRPGRCPAELAQLDAASLQAGWTSLFGRPPPKGMSRRLLELAAAYEAQARIRGRLKPAVRRRLLQLSLLGCLTRSPGALRQAPCSRSLVWSVSGMAAGPAPDAPRLGRAAYCSLSIVFHPSAIFLIAAEKLTKSVGK